MCVVYACGGCKIVLIFSLRRRFAHVGNQYICADAHIHIAIAMALFLSCALVLCVWWLFFSFLFASHLFPCINSLDVPHFALPSEMSARLRIKSLAHADWKFSLIWWLVLFSSPRLSKLWAKIDEKNMPNFKARDEWYQHTVLFSYIKMNNKGNYSKWTICWLLHTTI